MGLNSKKEQTPQQRKPRPQPLRKHPFVVPVTTFLFLFFLTMFGFIALGGQTIGATDSKVVQLFVDRREQVIPTRAKTIRDLLQRLDIKVNEKDIVEPTLDTEITDGGFQVNIYRARSVLVDDEGKQTVIVTAEATPEKVAEKAGLQLYPEDKVTKSVASVVEPLEAIQSGVVAEKVIIKRATPIKLNLYGITYDVRTHASTVQELVKERDIDSDNESVFPTLKSPIVRDGTIFITHPGKQIITVEEAIPQTEETVNDFGIPAGTRKVKSEGQPGKRAVVYEVAEDGVTKKLLQEVVLVQPVKKVIALGIQVIISNPSENVKTGERLAADRGWTGEEWYCLYSLWQRESGWSTTAGNSSTGAYGIPQALPGSKMGAGWQNDPVVQINWGLGYISGRYGTPCGAWSYFQVKNWY